MDSQMIKNIKKKREFSQLPDSIVGRVAEKFKGDVKMSRAFLRKYFGVFLTNKMLKGDLNEDEILEKHMSSKHRNYGEFYKKIFGKDESVGVIVDFGCGANGFSYKYLKKVLGEVKYVGVEATGQLVDLMNIYFEKNKFNAFADRADLFDLSRMKDYLEKEKRPRVAFLLQVLDAFERMKKGFTKEFLIAIGSVTEKIVVSFPTMSLSKKNKFVVTRDWLLDFLREEFTVERDFEEGAERVLVLGKK